MCGEEVNGSSPYEIVELSKEDLENYPGCVTMLKVVRQTANDMRVSRLTCQYDTWL